MKKLYEKMLQIQSLLPKYEKNWKANYWMYVKLDDLNDKLLPICNDKWILVYHKMSQSEVVTVVTDWEDSIESSFPVIATDPQKIWSAITYAKRYNLWQLFNIVTNEDTDWKDKKPTDNKLQKKEFTEKSLALFKWKSVGKTKTEVMQTMLEYKKVMSISPEMQEKIDLFLNQLS